MRNNRLSFSIRLFIPTLDLFVTKARPNLNTLPLLSLLSSSDQSGSSCSPHIHLMRDRRLRSDTEGPKVHLERVRRVLAAVVRTESSGLLAGLPLDLCLPSNVDLVRVRLPLYRIRPEEACRLVLDRQHVAFVREGSDRHRSCEIGVDSLKRDGRLGRADRVLTGKGVRCCFP
jgi:hypothetical protein